MHFAMSSRLIDIGGISRDRYDVRARSRISGWNLHLCSAFLRLHRENSRFSLSNVFLWRLAPRPKAVYRFKIWASFCGFPHDYTLFFIVF
jgi:hypothetical protein